jgi:MtN3 and saliva related transmembrane protein
MEDLPQQIWRRAFLRMLLALAFGLGLWIVYGIMIKSLPLIATNAFVFLLILLLIGMKLKFDRAPAKD